MINTILSILCITLININNINAIGPVVGPAMAATALTGGALWAGSRMERSECYHLKCNNPMYLESYKKIVKTIHDAEHHVSDLRNGNCP